MIVTLDDVCCPYCRRPPLSVDEDGELYYDPDGSNNPCPHLFAYEIRAGEASDNLNPSGIATGGWEHPALDIPSEGPLRDCWWDAVLYGGDFVDSISAAQRFDVFRDFDKHGIPLKEEYGPVHTTVRVVVLYARDPEWLAAAIRRYCEENAARRGY